MALLQPGHLLYKRYQIISNLAEGGFGYTYLSEDTHRPSKPQCVVKQLKPISSNPRLFDDAKRLFETEAKTLERLGEHNQIPRLLAYFEEDKEFYIVQEFIKGNPLSSEIKLGEPWSEKQVWQILREILEILSFVHKNKVIHRDIKPDNLIRRHEDNRLVLVDFGTVKQVLDIQSKINGTIAVGTDGYMPTEQGRGNPRCNSDIYALGIIAILAVTGLAVDQIREDPETGEIIWQPWAKNISDGFATVLNKMVRYHFKDRYKSAKEALEAIEGYLNGTPTGEVTPLPSSPETQPTLISSQFPQGTQSRTSEQETNQAQLPKISLSKPKATLVSSPVAAQESSIAQPVVNIPPLGNLLKKNLPIVLLIALVIALLGVIVWLLGRQDPQIVESPPIIETPTTPNEPPPIIETPTKPNEPPKETLSEPISSGKTILFTQEEIGEKNQAFQEAKQQGIDAMVTGDFPTAVKYFEQALKQYRNAPETLIYLNNARIGDQKNYTIAVAGPIGKDPKRTLEIVRGVAQAQDDINQAGGINGTPLKVVIAQDDEENVSEEKKKEISQNIAGELVKNEEILAVVGHSDSNTSLKAGEVYDSGRLVAISAVSTSVKLSNFSPYVFRAVPSDAFAARALADYMLENIKKQKAAVFFNSESSYSQSLKAEFTTSVGVAGGEVVDEIDLSKQDFDAAESVERAIERGAQVIMLAPNSGGLDKAVQVVTENSLRLPVLGGDVLYDTKTLNQGQENAVGMVVAVSWDIDGDPNSKFPRTSKQLWNAEVNWRTAMAYDATQALIEAIKRDPSRDGVQKALSSTNFVTDGVSQKIRFLPSGDRNASMQLVEVNSSNDFIPIPTK